jgi:hypothetical protein
MSYACGAGNIPNPNKQAWASGGSLGNIRYRFDVSHAPPIRPFVRPNANGQININVGYCSRVVVFGDSNMELFANSRFPNNQSNLSFHGNINAPLTLVTWNRRFLPRCRAQLKVAIQELPMLHAVAKVVGSNPWDLMAGMGQGVWFENHLQACERLLTALRNEFPTVAFYWRSAMAVHIHVATVVADHPHHWHQMPFPI